MIDEYVTINVSVVPCTVSDSKPASLSAKSTRWYPWPALTSSSAQPKRSPELAAIPRFGDSASAVRVSVNVDRFAESSCVGSIVDGPTFFTRSQLKNPGSVEPALTCGSSRSAPVAGARLSGTQGPELDAGICVGSPCGTKLATGDDGVEIRPPPEPSFPLVAALVDATAPIELELVAGFVVCAVAGELVVGMPIGKLKVGIGNGECVRCTSGSAAAAAASDGAIVSVAANSNVAAPAHTTSEAIEASRPRTARGRGRTGEGGRDTGRRPSVRVGDGSSSGAWAVSAKSVAYRRTHAAGHSLRLRHEFRCRGRRLAAGLFRDRGEVDAGEEARWICMGWIVGEREW